MERILDFANLRGNLASVVNARDREDTKNKLLTKQLEELQATIVENQQREETLRCHAKSAQEDANRVQHELRVSYDKLVQASDANVDKVKVRDFNQITVTIERVPTASFFFRCWRLSSVPRRPRWRINMGSC